MADGNPEKIAQLEKTTLLRKLGVSDLFAVGYGDLGSSIFYALGITTFYALGAAPLSLLLAGLVFVCTSLTYAEMTAAIQDSGGSASFARHAFNDFVSFIAGWGLLLDFIVTISISIFTATSYLSFLSANLPVSIHLGFSIGLIAILYLINYFGVQHSTRISIFLTGFALLVEFVIIGLGLFAGTGWLETIEHLRINVGQAWSPTWPEFWKGTAMAMVAYTGIESIAALGGETKRPIKTLPRAVMVTMSVLMFMYLAISLVGLTILTPQELGGEFLKNPIAGVVSKLPGKMLLQPLVGILAAALLFVAGNAGLMGASRLSFNMGEFYQLPRFFYKTHKRFKTPVISLAFFSFLASLVILWSRGKLNFLADLYNFGAMIAFFTAHLSLIVLRIKQPELPRPFRSPLNIKISKTASIPLSALLGALATFAVWVLVVITKPEGRFLGLAWMSIGILMYFLYRRKKKIAPMGQVKIEKVKIPDFQPLEIKSILVPTKGGAETATVQMACELAKLHKAKLTAIHLLQVPFSLPLNIPLPYRVLVGDSVLQRAEAIAREFGVDISTEIVRCRRIEEAVLQYLANHPFDLIVLGAAQSKTEPHAGLGVITDRILRNAPCRVFITTS